ncbi:enoyl-CoA hydratase [Rhodococcus triatomae]|uniref:Enoyl-CoA hydratase n=1 Tax=Rhodococcus triatomae TaxID=300028 RepID=A0A1G8AMP5_9NOCA|nr:enoyl-CoA hydratase [Rhodococcus triatomae]QNG17721.1 enoyl-CoA hydratase [Rhodococcus triatomae]QNG22612.1 enoyl-CoA hydratase [Rhodococcus triatomae]SDH22214.1 enoyl-CoA hydratase [Rhodococcus triatomae]
MIGTSREGDVITLELQREERRNALNTELCQALQDAVTEAVAEGARALVLTGRGPVFCAGADLSGSVYAEGFTDALVDMLRTVESAPVPVIAAVNGPAIGAGCQLATAADLRVVAPTATFSIPAARLGLSVDRWTIHRLSSLIGGGPARTLLLAAEQVDADAAFALGLANRLGDVAAAHDWARKIARLAPLSLQHMKLVFNDDGAHAESPAAELAALEAAWRSEDAKEARAARSEKRHPEFRGR